MKYLTIDDVLKIHERLIEKYGGSKGIRDFGLLESSVSQPKMTFDEKELYPTLVEKAGILGYSLIRNHCFIDGNKRIGHASIEIFLLLNGFEIFCNMDEQEEIIMSIARGELNKYEFFEWLRKSIQKR